MSEYNLNDAIAFLADEFRHLDFTFHHYKEDGHSYLKNLWPGKDDESVMVCVYQGSTINEPFHRHDFIYFNYAYKNNYAALSDTDGNLITVHEGECYIGQPFSGYALRSLPNTESTIVGVLIKKELFFRNFLQTFASDNLLFHFFIDPEREKYTDKYLHFSFRSVPELRPLLEVMIMEYANRKDNTQQILLSLAQALYSLVARTYKTDDHLMTNAKEEDQKTNLIGSILDYIDDNFKTISLNELADHFSYHPNYISGLLHKETGKTFTQILLEKRMEHALVLMKGTDLSNEEIADAIGYINTTNYYKAFRKYFHMTPREYEKKYLTTDKIQRYPLSQPVS